MTRQERAKTNTEAREAKAKAKVINAITGLMSETYKKLNGKWNISKIAEDTKLNRRTVSKHINNYLAEHDQSVEAYKASKR